jgi:hypothetical protein
MGMPVTSRHVWGHVYGHDIHLCRHLNRHMDNPYIDIVFKGSYELQYKNDKTDFTCWNLYMLIMFINFNLDGILDFPHAVRLD